MDEKGYVMLLNEKGETIEMTKNYQIPPDAYDYLIFKEADYVLVKNGRTGEIEFKSIDEATAIQYALDNGSSIEIKSGTYKISRTITINKRTKLTGKGHVLLQLADNVDTDMFLIQADASHIAQYITIENLVLDGNKANNTKGNGIKIASTHVNYAFGMQFKDLIIKNFADAGIRAEYTQTSIFENITSENNAYGIYLLNSSYCEIRGGFYEQNNYGIYLDGSSRNIVNNVEVNMAASVGIYTNSYYNIFENIYCALAYDNTTAIKVDGYIRFFTIRDAKIEIKSGSTPAGTVGIDASNARYGIIAHSHFNVGGVTALGTAIKTLNSNIIRDNHIFNADVGVQLVGTGNVVTDNYFDSVTTPVSGDLTTNTVKDNVGYTTESRGVATFSGDGTTTQFAIEHGLVSTPSKVLVTAMSADAAGDFYVTADDTYIYVNYSSAPASGTDNVKLSWYAEV